MGLVSEEVLYQSGCFKVVRRWYEGWHDFGDRTFGWNGEKQTVVWKTVVGPIGTFEVVDGNCREY